MATTATSVERELLDLDRKYRDAMKAGDTATLERLTADPCIVVGSQGATQFKRKEVATMSTRSGGPRLLSYRIDDRDVSFRELGKDAAALAYRVHEEYDQGGARKPMDSYNCSVWIRNGSNWECAVHTESEVANGAKGGR